ncbi:MAG: winged helix-turn-helix domain-containing protein [Mucilaginibacter sp.]
MGMVSYKTRIKLNTRYLLGFAGLLLVATICAAFALTTTDDFDRTRQEILFRKIGHEVLLHSGDSTSRVMPVKRIANNEYQVRFENEFTFQPDSLVQIIRRVLAKDNLADNYMVNVLDCSGKGMIFGYVIYKDQSNNIVPCSGRKQPKNCYVIDVKFQSPAITTAQKGYLLGGLPLLAFIGLIISGSVKSRKNKSEIEGGENESIKIGSTLFYPTKRQITTGENLTELTAKESKLLLIFAESPNVVIERSRLQKEIWEDEGVIVGRSLDMFISKLRKKLQQDTSICLLNIHGKGYKLEIGSHSL